MTHRNPLTAGPHRPEVSKIISLDRLQLNIVATLPTDGEPNEIVLLDIGGGVGVLYQYVGNAWVPLGGSGSIDASDVTYTNPAYPSVATVKDMLDVLTYSPLAVSSMSLSVGTVDIGSTVNTLDINWGYNKPSIASQTLAPTPGSIGAALRTMHLTGLNLTSDTTYTVTGNDGLGQPGSAASASRTVAFRNRRWWGVSSNAALTDLTQLVNNEFASNRNQTRSFNASAQYLYFAWPSSFGTPSFVVNGLPNSAWVKTTVSWTNGAGYTTNFDIYRSTFLQNGSGIAVTVN